jgi:hypothetical protein
MEGSKMKKLFLNSIREVLFFVLVVIFLIVSLVNILFADVLGDFCQDTLGCIGCPPNNCWICGSIGSVFCYKPAPYTQ